MKQKLLPVAKLVLWATARLMIKRYKPHVIGITGSVGKTSTKKAIYTVLDAASGKRVRMAGGNLNNEIGLPLAVIGDYEETGGWKFGLKVMLDIKKEFFKMLIPRFKKSYPEILILEYGADHPGDIPALARIAPPDIAVVTAVGAVPVHVEFYEDVRHVATEKARLVKALREDGVAVLNADDEAVFNMKAKSKAPVRTFGFSKDADLRVKNFKNRSGDAGYGISLVPETGGKSASLTVQNVFGKSQAYALAAAAAVGLVEGISLDAITESLSTYTGEKGRTRLLPGVKNSFILDDSYNSSPASAEAALGIVKDFSANKKIAVLGDMLELGIYMEKAHRDLGKLAAGTVDELVTVGPRARFIAEGAKAAEFPERKIHSFDTSDDAKLKVQELIEEGDIILVKGSQAIRTEKIVKEIMAEPQRAEELLVRQYGEWLES